VSLAGKENCHKEQFPMSTDKSVVYSFHVGVLVEFSLSNTPPIGISVGFRRHDLRQRPHYAGEI